MDFIHRPKKSYPKKNSTVLNHKQLDNVHIAENETFVPLTFTIVQFISTHWYDH